MATSSQWTTHDGVRLHYLDKTGSTGTPALFVPGLSDWATDYEWLLESWWPRRLVVADLRGRGASEAPATGYRLEDHVGDVDAVVRAAGLDRVHLVTFSRGTAYALGWALGHPGAVVSLTVGDYNAKQVKLPPEFPGWWMSTRWRGRPMTDIMAPHVIEQIQKDSEEVLFWDEMSRLACPVLVLRAGSGLLDDEAVERWRDAVPHAEVETFADSPHDLFRPDRHHFARVVGGFIARHEPADAEAEGTPAPAGGQERLR